METEMIKKLVHVPSRIGRELQRYHSGRRQVVGCIPYRLLDNFSTSIYDELQVLMVSSQKGDAMMFPKGGWETDESMQEAAVRESLEEAGVIGSIQNGLGQWTYKSKNQDIQHDGYMFPLLVEEELEYWPEKDSRQRKWVMVNDAQRLCPHKWMKEALDLLVQRLTIDKYAIDAASTPRFSQQAMSLLYYLQTPHFPQTETRLSSNRKTVSPKINNKGETGHLSERLVSSRLKKTKSEASGYRNLSTYLHRLNSCSASLQMNTSTCETTVLFSIEVATTEKGCRKISA